MNREQVRKGGGYVLAGLFGYLTGEYLPPEVFGALIGAII